MNLKTFALLGAGAAIGAGIVLAIEGAVIWWWLAQ
jgi:hypothetical protein